MKSISLPGCNTTKCGVVKKNGGMGGILLQNILQGVIFLSHPPVIGWHKMDFNTNAEQALDTKGQT